LNDCQYIKVSADQVCCDLDGEAVILSLKTGKYYGLDEVGAKIWTLIQEPRSLGELVDAIRLEFEVEAVRCRQDLCVLIQTLTEVGLVEVGDSHDRPLPTSAGA
jgi:hypothetical protein